MPHTSFDCYQASEGFQPQLSENEETAKKEDREKVLSTTCPLGTGPNLPNLFSEPPSRASMP